MEQVDLKNSKHILLIANNSSLANATALYSYLLTLHKKVSLYSSEPVLKCLSFLPWYEKVSDHKSMSADLVIEVSAEPVVDCFFAKRPQRIGNIKLHVRFKIDARQERF